MSETHLRPKKPTRNRKPKTRNRDHHPKGHSENSRPTKWGLVLRLAPIWILFIAILLIAPTLPLKAVAAVVDVVTANREAAYTPHVTTTEKDLTAVADLPSPDWNLMISPIFTKEVQYWQQGIAEWSIAYRIEPNQIATIMQIESCGNPKALSSAGAQGLFQVMDLHFAAGEDPFDPETNAKRALLYFGELLALTHLDEGLSYAAYNAGPGIITQSPTEWPRETRDYQYWASGILEEAERNISQSPTLNEWLDAGGQGLCNQAAEELGLPPD